MKSSAIGAALFFLAAVSGFAATVPVLGSAATFAVLGGSTVTNTGATTITGNVGLYSGPSITGFAIPPANTVVEGPGSTGLIAGAGLATGTIHISDIIGSGPANAQQAQVDLTKAYTALALLAPTRSTPPADVGGLSLLPGVYKFSDTATITGTLQLNAQSTDGAYWVFQIGSTLTTAVNAAVSLINDSVPGHTGVFWVVGTDATLGTGTTFVGNLLAQNSIIMNTGASILNGSALARTAAVTLNTNNISPGVSGGLVFENESSTTLVPIGFIPEPSTLGLLGLGVAILCGYGRRRKHVAGG